MYVIANKKLIFAARAEDGREFHHQVAPSSTPQFAPDWVRRSTTFIFGERDGSVIEVPDASPTSATQMLPAPLEPDQTSSSPNAAGEWTPYTELSQSSRDFIAAAELDAQSIREGFQQDEHALVVQAHRLGVSRSDLDFAPGNSVLQVAAATGVQGRQAAGDHLFRVTTDEFWKLLNPDVEGFVSKLDHIWRWAYKKVQINSEMPDSVKRDLKARALRSRAANSAPLSNGDPSEQAAEGTAGDETSPDHIPLMKAPAFRYQYPEDFPAAEQLVIEEARLEANRKLESGTVGSYDEHRELRVAWFWQVVSVAAIAIGRAGARLKWGANRRREILNDFALKSAKAVRVAGRDARGFNALCESPQWQALDDRLLFEYQGTDGGHRSMTIHEPDELASGADEAEPFVVAFEHIAAKSQATMAALTKKVTAPTRRVLYPDMEQVIWQRWQVRPDDVTVGHLRHALYLLATQSEGGVELERTSCEASGIDYDRLMPMIGSSPGIEEDMSFGPKVPRKSVLGAQIASKKRGRPVSIAVARKEAALAAREGRETWKAVAKILYNSAYPSAQQVKNAPNVLKNYMRTRVLPS